MKKSLLPKKKFYPLVNSFAHCLRQDFVCKSFSSSAVNVSMPFTPIKKSLGNFCFGIVFNVKMSFKGLYRIFLTIHLK